MWLLILFGVLLVFGPTRRMVVGNWRFYLPMIGGAIVGWELGIFVFGSKPMFFWVPWAWAVILGLAAGKNGKRWLDQVGGRK